MSLNKMLMIPQTIFNDIMSNQNLNSGPGYVNNLAHQSKNILASNNIPLEQKAAEYDRMYMQYIQMRNQELNKSIPNIFTRPEPQSEVLPIHPTPVPILPVPIPVSPIPAIKAPSRKRKRKSKITDNKEATLPTIRQSERIKVADHAKNRNKHTTAFYTEQKYKR